MISVAPTLGLAFLSFACSMFVILRVVIPILPPGPFSNRVSPAEFGLPNFKTLSPADKSHIWLAACDLVALALFTWQAVDMSSGSKTDFAISTDALSTGRLWLALTLRQTCLFVVAGLTLLHVRMGRPVSFGVKHWMLVVPTAILIVTSTGVAATLAGAGTSTFFLGLLAYSSALGVFSSIAFGCLIGTLLLIRRNLNKFEAATDAWPPAAPFVEEKPRASYNNEEVEQLKDGASWITSTAGSRRTSIISAFSYTTHHSRKPSLTSSLRQQLAENSSRQIKPSFWFPAGQEARVPPVPSLPEQYRPRSPTSAYLTDDADPFARATTPTAGVPQRQRPTGSATSWLTSESGSQSTLTAWSYPTTAHQRPATPALSEASHSHSQPERDMQTTTLRPSSAITRPVTPALSSAQVLGGYEKTRAEANVSTSTGGSDVDISVYRTIGWLITIWVPLALSLPYFITTTASAASAPQWASILLILSVTMSSPILTLNIIFRSPLPIPSDLFDSYSEPPSVVHRAPSPASSTERDTHEYKRSASVTVVEGRRSGDVWLANGDAMDAKNKIGRALNMLGSRPKLSVMPPAPLKFDGELSPTFPMRNGAHSPTPTTPTSATTETGKSGDERKRKESKASSYYSGTTDAVQHASRIMIAQRHYSTVATMLIVPPSPEQGEGISGRTSTDTNGNAVRIVTGVALTKDETPNNKGHLRARSVSSMSGPRSPISPPPASPLPPTPPTLKNSRLAQQLHRKSHSSASIDFSFGAIDNTHEIDALSAGVLPVLMPGLALGQNFKITDFSPITSTPAGPMSKSKKRLSSLRNSITSVDFGSPVNASTPKKGKAATRERTTSGHTRQHFSLPSLGLGKEVLGSLVGDINRAIQGTNVSYSSMVTEDGRRYTMTGESKTMGHLQAVREESFTTTPVEHSRPSHAMAPINTARSSMTALLEQIPPPSASSEVTLFDPEVDGPQAQSTPHESRVARSRSTSPAPPMPATRRSSIQYIRSDQAASGRGARRASNASRSESDSENDASGGATRAVRSVRPKPSRLQAVQEAAIAQAADGYSAVPSSPGGGIRPLSLLRDRDLNLGASSPSSNTRPLILGKKKVTRPSKANTENQGLKVLVLSRSDTTKERGLLRKTEVLPIVVVRPPSNVDNSIPVGYGYNI